jgi:hypothetical protein
MTKRRAAALGAVAGVAWAAAFMVTSTVFLRAISARWPSESGPLGLFSFLAVFAPTAGDPAKWLYFWPAAGLAGALTGLAGRRLHTPPARRVVRLWITFFPAVATSTGFVMWAMLIASDLWGHGFVPLWSNVLGLPAAVLIFFMGEVMVLPVLAWPLLAAAVTVEAWTRPPGPPQSPLGTSVAQKTLVSSLALVVLLGLGYLWLSWDAISGGTWLAP